MDAEIIVISAGQVIVLGGYFFWLLKRVTSSVTQIKVDLAVIKNEVQHIRQDHDKLILIEAQTRKHEDYLIDLYDKVRTIQ